MALGFRDVCRWTQACHAVLQFFQHTLPFCCCDDRPSGCGASRGWFCGPYSRHFDANEIKVRPLTRESRLLITHLQQEVLPGRGISCAVLY